MFGDRNAELLHSRQERLAQLEKNMIDRVLDGDSSEDIESISELYLLILQAEKVQARERPIINQTVENSDNWFSSLIGFIFTTTILATVFSYVCWVPCQHYKSHFCENTRIIPKYINSVFKEP